MKNLFLLIIVRLSYLPVIFLTSLINNICDIFIDCWKFIKKGVI